MSATLASQAAAPPPPPPKSDPFRLGWRTVVRHLDDGTETEERVPLTEWDLLHPQEDNFIVQNPAHVHDCIYLKQAIEKVTAERTDIVVFYDQRVDWQESGVLPHGPDITVLAEVTRPWDKQIGTFRVRDMNAKVLLVVEVTSPSTWGNDVDKKFREYHQAKIPYYVIVDTRDNPEEGNSEVVVNGYRLAPGGYVPIDSDPKRGVWIPTVGIGLMGENDRVRCVDRVGQPIPDGAEMHERVRESMEREREAREAEVAALESERLARKAEVAALEREREARKAEVAALEREREARGAEAATKSLALQEKLRADAAEDRIRELEDQLKTRQS